MVGVQSSKGASFRHKFEAWSLRNEKRLLVLNIFSLVLLFLGYLVTSSIDLYPSALLIIMQVGTLALAGLIVISLAAKGAIPLIISLVGIVLIYNAMVSP